jgi:hypothetical protein
MEKNGQDEHFFFPFSLVVVITPLVVAAVCIFMWLAALAINLEGRLALPYIHKAISEQCRNSTHAKLEHYFNDPMPGYLSPDVECYLDAQRNWECYCQ